MLVFLSSTIYDLLDVRAELADMFSQSHVPVVMSERAISDFIQIPDVHSIRSCLLNLARCDVVVVVLSQRYGARLEVLEEFKDVSATEAEFNEAIRLEKYTYFYVRSRLASEYVAWKKAGRPEDDAGIQALGLVWTPQYGSQKRYGKERQPNALSLFRLIDKRQMLGNNARNWYSEFDNSAELKQIVRKDLQLHIQAHRLEQELDRDELPYCTIEYELVPLDMPIYLRFYVRNIGSRTAYLVSFEMAEQALQVPCLGSMESFLVLEMSSRSALASRRVEVCYKTNGGTQVVEEWAIGATAVQNIISVECERKSKLFKVSRGDRPYEVQIDEYDDPSEHGPG